MKFFSLPQVEKTVKTGYVDYASSTKVSGWIKFPLKNAKFYVEIDGETQFINARFYARPDLIAQSIDAVGFEAEYRSPQTAFDLRVVVEAEKKTYLAFSDTGSEGRQILQQSTETVVLTADELLEFADAIEPDSVAYLSLLQKYGAVLGPRRTKVDVLFIDGTIGSVSVRYRIINIAEGLQECGYITRYACPEKTSLDSILAIEPRVVVFFRAPLDTSYQSMSSVQKGLVLFLIWMISFSMKLLSPT